MTAEIETSPFGDYFGAELSQLDCERLALERISGKLLQREASLFATKWFDYRGMHPTKATYLFVALFDKAFVRQIQRRIDHEIVNWHSFKGEDFLNLTVEVRIRDEKKRKEKIEREVRARTRTYTAFWKARQTADALGVPYDFYANKVMQWADMNIWQRVPGPNHAYSPEVVEFIKSAWEGACNDAIPKPLSGRFFAETFEGAPDQIEFQEWLCERIKRRPNVPVALASNLYLEKRLVREIAEDHFDPSDLARADSFAAQLFSHH